MKGIKLVIFDLDGTLINAYPAIISSFNYAMQRTGHAKQSAQVIRQAVGWGDRKLLAGFVAGSALKQALLIYRQHHQKALLSGSRLFPKARVLLKYLLNKRYKLAIASNRPTKFSRILLLRHKIEQYFDMVLCADSLKRGKPHPEILRKIIRHFSLEPKQALFIGDMTIDLYTGRRAKVKTIIVTTGSSTKAEIIKAKPYRIIHRIAEVAKIL